MIAVRFDSSGPELQAAWSNFIEVWILLSNSGWEFEFRVLILGIKEEGEKGFEHENEKGKRRLKEEG